MSISSYLNPINIIRKQWFVSAMYVDHSKYSLCSRWNSNAFKALDTQNVTRRRRERERKITDFFEGVITYEMIVCKQITTLSWSYSFKFCSFSRTKCAHFISLNKKNAQRVCFLSHHASEKKTRVQKTTFER